MPFDSGATVAGVARAPTVLRAAGLIAKVTEAGHELIDRGDVAIRHTTPDRDPVSGIIAPEALRSMIVGVRKAVGSSLRTGGFPLVIGGDCPVVIGCLGAVQGPDLGLLFVDGHEDAWPPHASMTGEAADMELGLLLGRSRERLPHELDALLPRVASDRVVIIGARDLRELADAGVASIEDIVDVVRTDGLGQAAIEGRAAERLAQLDGRGRWWLHVDLDVLSTENLAAVDYPQPGGLDWPTLTAITRMGLAAVNVAGWTVTIYHPDLDPGGAGAATIVDYIGTSVRARTRC